MSLPRREPWVPTREQLAAYADGELDQHSDLAELHCRIECWLESHPHAAADVEAQLELTRLMAETPPPEPGEAVWARVWANVEAAPVVVPTRRWPAGMWVASLALAATAAALLAIVNTSFHATPQIPQENAKAQLVQPAVLPPLPQEDIGQPQPQAQVEDIEVLIVASASEVEILQVAGMDTGTLVVGQPPLSGPLVLLQPHEVDIAAPSDGGMGLRFGSGMTPMVWVPLPDEIDD